MFERQFPQLAEREQAARVDTTSSQSQQLRSASADDNLPADRRQVCRYTMNDNWETDIAGLLAELADVQSCAARQRCARSGSCWRRPITRRSRRWPGASSSWSTGCKHATSAGSSCWRGPRPKGCRLIAFARSAISCRRRAAAACKPAFDEAAERSRLLQHQSLTNWVLVQRSLLHLSQLIEIIATGGRPKPTYGNGSDRQN